MDGLKLRRVTPETMRNPKVDTYLDDLRDRFKELRKQHDMIIDKSVRIIHEIGEASSSGFDFIESKNNPKIKDLIQGFECVSGKETKSRGPTIAMEKNVDVKKVLEKYEKLNGNELLLESLNLFKRAKDNLGKVDIFVDKICSEKSNSKNNNFLQNYRFKTNSKNQPRNVVDMQPVRPIFSSCFSSGASLNIFRSVEDCRKDQHENGSCDMGYQGDIDESEYDLHANKKKMGKNGTCQM